MNTKRFTAYVIMVLLVFIFTGCKNNSSDTSSSKTNASSNCSSNFVTGKNDSSKTSAGQEENSAVDNSPYLNTDLNKLKSNLGGNKYLINRNFISKSKNNYQDDYTYTTGNQSVLVEFFVDGKKIYAISTYFDPSILNDSSTDVIMKSILTSVCNCVDVKYDDNIWSFFKKNYTEQVKLTEDTGIDNFLTKFKDKKSNTKFNYHFVAEQCYIEVRPYES